MDAALFSARTSAPIEAISHARPAAANEKRRRASGADGAVERVARVASLCLAGRSARFAPAGGARAGRAGGRQGHHPCRAHRLQGGRRPPHRRGERGRNRRILARSGLLPSLPCDCRLWRRPRADGGVRAVPRRVVHRGRAERRARARQHAPSGICMRFRCASIWSAAPAA